jgi:hypothetical protein
LDLWDNVLSTKENAISFSYGVSSYPTYILIDPLGKIIYRISVDAFDINNLPRILSNLLK